MAQLHVTEWGDPSGDPVVCVHGVTGHSRRFRSARRDARGQTRDRRRPPWPRSLDLGGTVGSRDRTSPTSPRRQRRSACAGDVDRAQLRRPARRRARASRTPSASSGPCSSIPAMHVDPPVAAERAAANALGRPRSGRRTRRSTRVMPTTRSSPRRARRSSSRRRITSSSGDDGRYRWRYSPPPP